MIGRACTGRGRTGIHTGGKSPLGKRRRRREDKIMVHLREVGCVVWIGLIWLRIETCVVLM
jgi:hypothetical protein